MNGLRRWLGRLFSLMLLLALFASLVALLRHEPAYYDRAAVPPGPQRSQNSADFYRQISNLLSLLNDPEPDKPWQLRLSQEQINSYLAEGFVEANLDKSELPAGVSEPRLVLEPGRVRIGFRYGKDFWSIVVSVELRLWISPQRTEALLVQIERLRVGAVPIPVRYVQELLGTVLRRRNLEVVWYRHQGLPVAVIRFQPSRRTPTFHFTALQIEAGAIVVQGRTLAGS